MLTVETEANAQVGKGKGYILLESVSPNCHCMALWVYQLMELEGEVW